VLHTKAIDELIAYMMTNYTTPELLLCERDIGVQDTRLSAIELLDWLKRIGRLGKPSPLILEASYEWHKNFIRFFTIYHGLTDIFDADIEKIDFREDVPLERRLQLARRVNELYKPRIRK